MSTASTAIPAYDLTALRSQFEVTQQGVIYLNHAGMSPLPVAVKEAVIHATQAMAATGSRAYDDVLVPLLERLPHKLAAFVGAALDEVAFVENTSTGINLIAHSLPLVRGDNVILCDVEFPANVYPWLNLGRTRGVDTRLIPARDGGLPVEAIAAARDARTRVVAVSGVQFFTGRREDLAAIGHYCADHGLWLVVDAIQMAGIIPIDMQAMGIHALAAGGQKALCAPPGQGFLAIRRELIEQMAPVFIGGISVEGWEHWLHYDMTPRAAAGRFALGTPNIAGLAGLEAAVDLLAGVGVQHIDRWVTHLSSVAIADLVSRGFHVITPPQPEHHASIVTFAWDGDALAAVAVLQERGLVLREHQDAGGRFYLRLSMHGYNTAEEITHAGKLLEEVFHEQH